MNYLNQERQDALAAEYVLGTLRGAARKRFQQLLVQYPSLRATTDRWEQHINNLGEQVTPISPDPIVWQKVKLRLAFDDPRSNTIVMDNIVPIKTKSSRKWQTFTGLASAAAIVLAVLLIQVKVPITQVPVEQLSVMQNTDNQPMWLIEVSRDVLTTTATINVTKRAQNDYQLWMLAEDGRPPISLGLLPQSGVRTLNKVDIYDRLEIVALAVSLEPLGGSPNGAPTEVLFVAELAIL
ncbi:anti-sigma factor [uncultured Paraglaciecola sp.]|uniref:anti-sigma factor n=1 Tax=uncultured Paraglaciecola sp. TaxID=1765024 RepID=UPI0030DD0BE5|tara:strand:- start:26641 stop:27354 length:714 start_codon:yes stop_codon:yes gene_type:complete